jgi:NAD-dependent SIR2 family protein deacetylase
VLPVAGLPIQALDRGAHLIILNNTSTYLDVRADSTIHGDVAEMLPALAEQVSHG